MTNTKEKITKEPIALPDIKSVRIYAQSMYHKGVAQNFFEPIDTQSESYRQLIDKLRQTEVKLGDSPFVRKDRPLPEALGLMMCFQTVNFCYTYPSTCQEYTYTQNTKSLPGALGLFTAMAESDVRWNDIHELKKLTQKQWTALAQITPKNPLFLGEHRYTKFLSLAQSFSKLFGETKIDQCLAQTNYDLDKLIPVIKSTGLFEDPLLKRGQLLVRALHSNLIGHGNPGIKNLEMLTVMGDSRLPQLLYNTGVLTLSPETKKRLTDHEILPSGDPLIDCLRGAAVHIGAYIARDLRLSEAETDSRMWWLATQMNKAGKMTTPSMLALRDMF